MNHKPVYSSKFKERSHASTPMFTLFGLMALVAYFLYAQNDVIDGVFIIFAAIGVLIVALIAISYKSFDIYDNRFETYYVFSPKSRKEISFEHIKRIELMPAKYNDWSINRLFLHLNDGKTIKLDGGSKYIEIMKTLNSLGHKIYIQERKKLNYNAQKAIKSGVEVE